MKIWIVPQFSMRAEAFFVRLPAPKKRRLIYLTQFLPSLVESKIARVADNTRPTPEYILTHSGFWLRFRFLPQSGQPVIEELRLVEKPQTP